MIGSEKKWWESDLSLAIERFYEKPENATGGILQGVLEEDRLDDASIARGLLLAATSDDKDAAAICRMLLAIPCGAERYVARGYDPDYAVEVAAEDCAPETAMEL